MKTYRIYLKNGVSFTIKALRVEWHSGIGVDIQTEEGTRKNKDAFIHPSEVAAIIPVELLVNDGEK